MLNIPPQFVGLTFNKCTDMYLGVRKLKHSLHVYELSKAHPPVALWLMHCTDCSIIDVKQIMSRRYGLWYWHHLVIGTKTKIRYEYYILPPVPEKHPPTSTLQPYIICRCTINKMYLEAGGRHVNITGHTVTFLPFQFVPTAGRTFPSVLNPPGIDFMLMAMDCSMQLPC